MEILFGVANTCASPRLPHSETRVGFFWPPKSYAFARFYNLPKPNVFIFYLKSIVTGSNLVSFFFDCIERFFFSPESLVSGV